MFVFTGDRPDAPMRASLLVQASRLRSLANDFDLFSEGAAPIERFLEQPPVLEDWRVHFQPRLCLQGTAHRDPDGRDGFTTTAPILAIHPAAGWARTITGFYGLGQPALSVDGSANKGEVGHD